VAGAATEEIVLVDPVGHQAASGGEEAKWIDGGQAIFGRQLNDQIATLAQ
jgi:hypothetical protein